MFSGCKVALGNYHHGALGESYGVNKAEERGESFIQFLHLWSICYMLGLVLLLNTAFYQIFKPHQEGGVVVPFSHGETLSVR